MKISLGYLPYSREMETTRLEFLSEHKDSIHDIHFAHWNWDDVPSGRPFQANEEEVKNFIEINNSSFGFNLNLLINSPFIKDWQFESAVKHFRDYYYPAGVRMVVISNHNYAKLFKDAFPDVKIHGSLISQTLTYRDWEAYRGLYSIFNPISEIIRMPDTARENCEAGYKQKIIFSEGCIPYCPYVLAPEKEFGVQTKTCYELVEKNLLLFMRGNWVTMDRFKRTILPYVELVKIPRSSIMLRPSEENFYGLLHVKRFFEIFNSDEADYNILDVMDNIYKRYLVNRYEYIPASLFDDDFFNRTSACHMNCSQRRCYVCYDILEKLENESNRWKEARKDKYV